MMNIAEIIPAMLPELQPPPPELPIVPGSCVGSSYCDVDMVMLSSFVAERVPDTALTVNVDVPVAVGVPEIVPDELRVSPAGRLPDSTDQVTPETFAERFAEYLTPK